MEDGAAQFEKQAGSLKNKYASNNLIIAAVVGVLVLGGFYWYLFMQPPPAPGVPCPPGSAPLNGYGHSVLAPLHRHETPANGHDGGGGHHGERSGVW